MDEQIFRLLTGRLDQQDKALEAQDKVLAEILKQTTATNGHVARLEMRTSALEKQDEQRAEREEAQEADRKQARRVWWTTLTLVGGGFLSATLGAMVYLIIH